MRDSVIAVAQLIGTYERGTRATEASKVRRPEDARRESAAHDAAKKQPGRER